MAVFLQCRALVLCKRYNIFQSKRDSLVSCSLRFTFCATHWASVSVDRDRSGDSRELIPIEIPRGLIEIVRSLGPIPSLARRHHREVLDSARVNKRRMQPWTNLTSPKRI